MKRPFKDKRLIGPFIDYSSNSSDPVFESDNDVEQTAQAIVRRTPAKVNRAVYQGYFSEPSINIDFNIPSASPYTVTREYHSSSANARASDGKITEFSMRFPAVNSEHISRSEFDSFLSEISPDGYRQRTDEFSSDGTLHYHGHIHYSAKRRGEKGPKLTDEVSKINSTIRQWYARIDDVLANASQSH